MHKFPIHGVRIAILASLSCAATAAAWNSPGHMTVALVAYDHMTAAARQQAVALLRAHPRFADHFEGPLQRTVGEGTDAEQDQWLFAYASTWPDVVRSSRGRITPEDVSTYNRPWWHFINEPVFLNAEDAEQLLPTLRFNRLREPPSDPDDEDMNVIQAIKSSAKIVGDKNAAAALRSVRLCWLLHLVGDAHQPLHSSALVTARRYPEGDHGGNYVHISHDYPLHAFWDDQVSTEEPYETVRNLALDLSQEAKLAAAGEQAAAQLDPGAWIDEGHVLAKKYAYTPEIIALIEARERHPHLAPLNPSPQYAVDAEAVSERQAVLAGHRLAKLLESLLP